MPEVAERPAKAPTARPSGASQAVLIIDDDKAVLHSLAVMLEACGLTVVTARDGVEGLRVFRETRPAAVLTDIIMPEKDGIGMILQMRKEFPEAKIIAMSGGGRVGKMEFLDVAQKLGADATLHKPLDPKHLLDILDKLLQRAR